MKKRYLFHKTLTAILFITSAFVWIEGCAGPEGPALKENVNQALEHYYRGEQLERKRDYEGAKEEYLASIEISPRPRAYFRLAQVTAALGDIDKAIGYLDEALRLSPNYEAAAQAKKQLVLRKQTKSSELSSEAVKQTQEDKEEKVSITELPAEGEVPQVEVTSEEETVEEITQPQTQEEPTEQEQQKPNLDSEAQSLLQSARKAEAAKDWVRSASLGQQILERYPNHAETLNRVGFAQFQLGNFDKAEEYFRQATKADPDFAGAYNNLGVVLENLGRSEEAEKAYEQAIESGHGDACFNLAVLKEKQAEYKEAISYYEKYLKHDSLSIYATHARERIEKLRRIEY